LNKTSRVNERYLVSCPSCGDLETLLYFGDAVQYAQRQQQRHQACGGLTVMNRLARRGAQQTFDRFGETLKVRA